VSQGGGGLNLDLGHVVMQHEYQVGNGGRIRKFPKRFHGRYPISSILGSERFEKPADQPHIARSRQKPFPVFALEHAHVLKYHRPKFAVACISPKTSRVRIAPNDQFANQINEAGSPLGGSATPGTTDALEEEQGDCRDDYQPRETYENRYR
jgi:hypothetical protein